MVRRPTGFQFLYSLIYDLLKKNLGFGWWTVIIGTVVAKSQRLSDSDCDPLIPFLIPSKACDPYVIVYVDENEMCRTSIKEESSEITFFHKCRSKKMRKTATIKLELWDSDRNGDDLLLSWTTNIETLSNTSNHVKAESKNVLTICQSIWQDEFPDAQQIE